MRLNQGSFARGLIWRVVVGMTGCRSAEVFVWCFPLHMPLSFEFYLQVAYSDDFFLLRGSEVGTRVADGKGFLPGGSPCGGRVCWDCGCCYNLTGVRSPFNLTMFFAVNYFSAGLEGKIAIEGHPEGPGMWTARGRGLLDTYLRIERTEHVRHVAS